VAQVGAGRADSVEKLCAFVSTAMHRSFFARELEYLASKGYRVAQDGWSMIAP
jgi:hypothetical protein